MQTKILKDRRKTLGRQLPPCPMLATGLVVTCAPPPFLYVADPMVQCIHFHERCRWFSATFGSDTLVAMSFYDQSVRIHRLREQQLIKLTRFHVNGQDKLQWIDDRLHVVTEYQSDTII